MALYKFRISFDGGGVWRTEADNAHEAQRKFDATDISDMELYNVDTETHEVTVWDSSNKREVYDEEKGEWTEILEDEEESTAPETPREEPSSD